MLFTTSFARVPTATNDHELNKSNHLEWLCSSLDIITIFQINTCEINFPAVLSFGGYTNSTLLSFNLHKVKYLNQFVHLLELMLTSQSTNEVMSERCHFMRLFLIQFYVPFKIISANMRRANQ